MKMIEIFCQTNLVGYDMSAMWITKRVAEILSGYFIRATD